MNSSLISRLFRTARTSVVRPARALSTLQTPPSPPLASTSQAIDLIRSEPSQYVVAVFLGRRYILSSRDVLTVPRIRDVAVGDVLSLNAIQEVGSRQYTLRGDPVLPTDVVRVQATIVEHTKSSLVKVEKFKRRKGYKRALDLKQPFTKLRIGPIELGAQQAA